MIFLLALLATGAQAAPKPVCSNNFLASAVPGLGFANLAGITTCTQTYAIGFGVNDGSMAPCNCLQHFTRQDMGSWDCYQAQGDTLTFAIQWGVCNGVPAPAEPEAEGEGEGEAEPAGTCSCVYSECTAVYNNCQGYIQRGLYADDGACLGDVIQKGMAAQYGGAPFDFDGTLTQCCLDSVMATDPQSQITCPYDDSQCTNSMNDCAGMLFTCGTLPTQAEQDACFGASIWNGVASDCCQIYMIKQSQQGGGNYPTCTSAESSLAMAAVTDPVALAACLAWSQGAPVDQCECLEGVPEQTAYSLSHCSVDGGPDSFLDMWDDCNGSSSSDGAGSGSCGPMINGKPVCTAQDQADVLADAQRLARGGDAGAQICVNLIQGIPGTDERDGCRCLNALAPVAHKYDCRWDPCDQDSLLDSATDCAAMTGCKDDPMGLVAKINKPMIKCSTIAYNQGFGWSCDQYDSDFVDGIGLMYHELCPSSCMACNMGMPEPENPEPEYPEPEGEGSGCANDGSPVCGVQEQTDLITLASQMAATGATQMERDGAAVCLKLAAGTSTDERDGCICLMALPDAALMRAGCRWGACDSLNMFDEKQACLARTGCMNDPMGYLKADNSGKSCEKIGFWTNNGGWDCATYDNDFNGVSLTYNELCPSSCFSCNQAPEPEPECNATCGYSLMDCARELQGCTDAINKGQIMMDSYQCLGQMFQDEMTNPGSTAMSSCCKAFIEQSEDIVNYDCPVHTAKCSSPGMLVPADCAREDAYCLQQGSPMMCMEDMVAAGKVSHCCMAYINYMDNQPPQMCTMAELGALMTGMTDRLAIAACNLWMSGDDKDMCVCMSDVSSSQAMQLQCSPDGGKDTFEDLWHDCQANQGLPMCQDTDGPAFTAAWATVNSPVALAACTAWGAGQPGQECMCIGGISPTVVGGFQQCSLDGGPDSFYDVYQYCTTGGGITQCPLAAMTAAVQSMGDRMAMQACLDWMSGKQGQTCTCMAGVPYDVAAQWDTCSPDGGPETFLDIWENCGGNVPDFPTCSASVPRFEQGFKKLVKGNNAAQAACTDVFQNGNYNNLCGCLGGVKVDKAKAYECTLDAQQFPEASVLMQVAECNVGTYSKPTSTGTQITWMSTGFSNQADCEASLKANDPAVGNPLWNDSGTEYVDLCTNTFDSMNSNDGYLEESWFATCDAPGQLNIQNYSDYNCKRKSQGSVESYKAMTCESDDDGYWMWLELKGGNCDAPVCCMANTAACLACQAGVTEKKFCKKNKTVPGCGKKVKCKKLKKQADCTANPKCMWQAKNAKKGKCKDNKGGAPAPAPEPEPEVNCSAITNKQKCGNKGCKWKRGQCN